MVIFTITAVEGLDAQSRCVGWFKSVEDAEKAVKENKMDFSESGSYKYAVIEKVEEGVYPFSSSDEQKWYKVEVEQNENGIDDILYKECDVPIEYKNISNFSIG